MPFDSVTTRSVAEDLQAHLAGGRVDKVVQPADLTVALLLRAEYANQWLVLSAHAQQAHVQRTLHRQTSGFSEPSSFVMLLRKYLEGARLRAVDQLGVDRVLRLRFEGGEGETVLIAEVMGRYSNVVLTDPDMLVLGAVKHVRADENRVRVILPRRPYLPPPRPMQPPPHADRPKLNPLHASAGEIAIGLGMLEPSSLLWKGLLDLVDGLSPTLAREVTYLHAGTIEAQIAGGRDLDSCRTLISLIRERFAPTRGEPSAIWQGEKLVEYAAFPLHYHGVEPRLYPDIVTLLDEVNSGATVSDPMAGQRGPVVQAIDALRKTQRRKIASLESSLVDEQTLATMRNRGEMVLAYQHSIEPGQRELAIPEMGLKVALDPELTPLENAQRMFKQYGKARDAGAVVPGLLQAARNELAYLDQLAVHAALANDPQSLAAVREELRELSITPEQAAKKNKKQDKRGNSGKANKGKGKPGVSPLRVKAADGTEILVGRSAKQNDAVTFSLAGPQDIWLHARQIPGAHVILKVGGRSPGNETLLEAAVLAATYSQGRTSTTVPVDYTQVRNVRRIKGAKPGLVHYSGETTINVQPNSG
ncbi:MAG: fibronectin/fibrinogen-binding protein [Chloroflexi bacterium]|nr:fibronectin/fibrinogen-binding protein [Chloroflexota bacterium]